MEKVLQQILEQLKALRSDVTGLQKGQEALQANVTELRQGQDEIRQGQQNLQGQITKLEVRLETEAFEKIGALFDGFQLHREILERIEARLKAHDERLDSHGDEIVSLRSKKK